MSKKYHSHGISRPVILAIIFTFLFGILLHRIYVLQIVNGENYRNNFNTKTTKTRTLLGTRGNIYDRNGKILAYNTLSHSLTIEDCGTYDTNRLRDLSLNGEAYRISKILKKNGDSLSNDFHVVIFKSI